MLSIQVLGLTQVSSLGTTTRIGHIHPEWSLVKDLQEVAEVVVATLMDVAVVLVDIVEK